jgi:hypothetical protein
LECWYLRHQTSNTYQSPYQYSNGQCLVGNWDISSLTDAIGMFDDSKMSIANMDNTLRGWAKLDTATGETAIQNNVTWDIKNYTDATARQYLIGCVFKTIIKDISATCTG